MTHAILSRSGSSPDRILRRATAFWHEREDTDARQWRDDGGLDIQAHLGQNLFFMRSNFS